MFTAASSATARRGNPARPDGERRGFRAHGGAGLLGGEGGRVAAVLGNRFPDAETGI